ncbi:MAG: hypothetical protein RUMPE_00698 [Eubacteriales bacterium SKADARSKE-1]|nr:hypothetical protein [Eubacteriales bacterium SKADARSKE-1]
MNIIGLIGIALVAAILSVMLKKYTPEYAIVLSILTSIFLFGIILSNVTLAIDKVKNLITLAGMPMEYAMILFKALGICFLAQFSADSCNDAGETALASKIEFVAKIIIIILSLPLFEEVIKMVTKLFGG